MTSHDVVSRARRLLRTKKIGHTGTLDPLATGVLVLCVGKATRLADYIQAGEKQYICRLLLGKGTDTLDTDGTVTAEVAAGHIGAGHVSAVLPCLRGEQLQTPPAVSAIKKDGVP
ncbi:MAG: tRNA pseudouridine(55) synthase TruB, partial [Abditibacteriota bacterium]|nr:tRNA pseudouridine(55) synthase TruB [Abditibacteriota bacterium]